MEARYRRRLIRLQRPSPEKLIYSELSDDVDTYHNDNQPHHAKHYEAERELIGNTSSTSSTSSTSGPSKGEKENSVPAATPAASSPLRSMYLRTVGAQRGSFQLLDDESDHNMFAQQARKRGTTKTPRPPRTPKTPKTPLNETPPYLFYDENATTSSPLLGPPHLSRSASQSSTEAFHNISDIFKAALDAELTKKDFQDPFAKVTETDTRRELQRGRRSYRSSIGSRSTSGSRVSSADDCSLRPPRANRRNMRGDSPNKANSPQSYMRSASPTTSPRVTRGSSMSPSPTWARHTKPLSPSFQMRLQQQQSEGSGGRDPVPFDERESRRRAERERILRLMNGLDALLVDTPKSSNELPLFTSTAAATAAATAKARAASAQERVKIKRLVHGLDQLLVDTPTSVREQGPSSFHEPRDKRRPPLSSSGGKERVAFSGYHPPQHKGANQAFEVSRGPNEPATSATFTETPMSSNHEIAVTIRTKMTDVSAITSRATESVFSEDSLNRQSVSSESTSHPVVENPTVSTLPSANTMDEMLAPSINSADNAIASLDPVVEMAWNSMTPPSQVALLLQRSTSIDSFVGGTLKKPCAAYARTPPKAETTKDQLPPSRRSDSSSILLEAALREQDLDNDREQIKQHNDQLHQMPMDRVRGESKLNCVSAITTTTTMESGPFLEIPDLQNQQVLSEITAVITQKSSDETAASGRQDASLTKLAVSRHHRANDDKHAHETRCDDQARSHKIVKETVLQEYTGTPVTVKTSTSGSTTDMLKATMLESHHDPPKQLQLPSLSTDDNNEDGFRCSNRNPSDEQPQADAWMQAHPTEVSTHEQPHSKICKGNFAVVQQTDVIEAVKRVWVPVPAPVPTTGSNHREIKGTVHGKSPSQAALNHAMAVVSRPPIPSPVGPPIMNATPRSYQAYPSVRDRIQAFTKAASPQAQQLSPSHALTEGTTTGGISLLHGRSQGTAAVNQGAFFTAIDSNPVSSPDLQHSGSEDVQHSSSTHVGMTFSSEVHEQTPMKERSQPVTTLGASGADVVHEKGTELRPRFEVQSTAFLPSRMPPRQADHEIVTSYDQSPSRAQGTATSCTEMPYFQSPSRAQGNTTSYTEMAQGDTDQSVTIYLDEAQQGYPSDYGAINQEQARGNETPPTYPNQHSNGSVAQHPRHYGHSNSSRSPILPPSRHHYKPSNRPTNQAPRNQPMRTPSPHGYPSYQTAAVSQCDSNGSVPVYPYDATHFANHSPPLSRSRLKVRTTRSGASSHPVARKVLARSIESQEAQFQHGTSEIVDRNLAATPVAKTKHSRYHRGGKFQDEAPVSKQSSSHNQAEKHRADSRRNPARKEEHSSKHSPNSKERTFNKRRTSKETSSEGTHESRIPCSSQKLSCADDDATATTAAVTTVSEFTNISKASNVFRASSSGGSSSEDDEDEDERTSIGGAFAQNVMGMFDGFKLPDFTNCVASTKGVIDKMALGAERACIKAPEMPTTSKAAKKKMSKRRRTKTGSELASSIQRATSHRSQKMYAGEEPDGKHIF
jgi:hypothetical protein